MFLRKTFAGYLKRPYRLLSAGAAHQTARPEQQASEDEAAIQAGATTLPQPNLHLEVSNDSITDLRKALNKAHEGLVSLRLKFEATNTELAVTKNWNASLAASIHGYETQASAAKSDLAAVSALLEKSEGENVSLRKQLERQSRLQHRTNGSRLALSHMLDEARHEIDETAQNLSKKNDRISELLTRITTLESQLSNTFASKNAYARYLAALATVESRRLIGNLQKDQILETSPKFKHAWNDFTSYAQNSNCPPTPIIQCGAPKSGNTMFRFFYHNLVNITNTGAADTLTHNRLNEVQRNFEFPIPLFDGVFRPPVNFSYGNFPFYFHTHRGWEPFWNAFGKVLFVYRNPLDTMVSLWYQEIQFNKSARGSISIDDFSLREIHPWIHTYKSCRLGADVVVRYEDMMQRPLETFSGALEALEIEYDNENLGAAIAISEFRNIRKMEDNHGVPHGPHYFNPAFHNEQPPEWFDEDDVRFTRSGKIGQWKIELSSNTVERIHAFLEKEGVDGSDFVFEGAEND